MKNYIPILVQRDGKQELWRMDISRLSVTELIKLKEDLMKVPYDRTIQMLNAIIKNEIPTLISTSSLDNCSYTRSYKRNKKEAKIQKEIKMKKSRNRRKKYDKY